MTTHGQFNTKSPTIKRILREAAELSSTPSPDYHAAPIDTNLFEWHFTLRGPPPPSPFATGLYHGRIILPPTYPLRPPSFRFLTPSGRFEPNREICLSISGHHEESWQPAWGVRTALVALRSFMDSEAKGQLGGVEAGAEVRKRFAGESVGWRCTGCGGRSNGEIMKEREEEAAAAEKLVEEVVPEELKLGYRDELGKGKEAGATEPETSPSSAPADSTPAPQKTLVTVVNAAVAADQVLPSTSAVPTSTTPIQPQAQSPPQPQPSPLPLPIPQQQQQPRRPLEEASTTPLLDLAIIGIAVALGIMLIRTVLSLTS